MVQKNSVSRIIFNIFNYASMVAVAFVCVIPLWHVVMASLSDPRMLIANSGILFASAGNVTL